MQQRNLKGKIPLQRYWTTRYAWTLVIGLLIVTFVSAWWIRQTTLQDRLQIMEVMAEEIANEVVSGKPRNDRDLADVDVHDFLNDPGKYMNINSNPAILITNVDGKLLYQNQAGKQRSLQLNPVMLMEEADITEVSLSSSSEVVYIVKKPVTVNGVLLGWVVLLEEKAPLQEVNQEYKQLFLMVGVVALFGWLAIYIVSKRLAKPITEVAHAAEQIKDGNYDISLQEDVRELEVYELLEAFKDMSQRLEHLEKLRTELLAGVTHELKTPVTSISGLVQAVSDDVVTDDEAKEFLTMALQETNKLEKLVEDLLAFNSFATNTLPLEIEARAINEVITTAIEKWRITRGNEHVQVNIRALQNDVSVKVDVMRVEQILFNLCTNAADAQMSEAIIDVDITESEDAVYIDIADAGHGIDEDEQPFIFERFYRGKTKQTTTSGFGLGLAFSKMIAEAHHGDLQLKESSEQGSTFRLTLLKK